MRQNSEQIKLLLISCGLVIFLGFFEFLGVFTPFKIFLYQNNPFEILGTKIIYSASLPIRVIEKSYKSYRKVQDLEINYSQALARISQLEGVEQENTYLRSLISSSDIKVGEITLASTISSYGDPAVKLPVGENFSVGNPVLLSGTLLGRISEINQSQAKVVLLEQNFNEPILAKTQTGVLGIIKGDGKRIIFTEVDKTAEIKPGDRIISVGQAALAANLYIGKIAYKIDDEVMPVQSAVVDQGLSFFETNLVELRKD